uniref:Disease resistance R13L4/SHOC-2-like LRR domain-containing protein n=1 Tax=Leersia perrieri TaxID=77586 RepID=A0A0D9XVG2_9ORYZ
MKALRVLTGIEIDGESTAVAGLHQMTALRKLAIYKLSVKKDGDTFKELFSSIEYFGSCGLQTLIINDEDSGFINSLDEMKSPPRYLVALDLTGKLRKLPGWITKMNNLIKLTISITVLQTKTFEILSSLSSLFSLTFSLRAGQLDQDIVEFFEEHGGFKSLKLLRFFAPLVPRLSFSDNAMTALEMIDMRFENFEGLFGIDTLKSLQEVHLCVNGRGDKITKFLVDDLKNNEPKVIVDQVIAA